MGVDEVQNETKEASTHRFVLRFVLLAAQATQGQLETRQSTRGFNGRCGVLPHAKCGMMRECECCRGRLSRAASSLRCAPGGRGAG